MESRQRSLKNLHERLSEGRFNLAILGQFKRGKSTLLNAILGEDILPSSVIPLTAIPTFVRYGSERTIRIHFQDRREEEVHSTGDPEQLRKTLLDYVSKEANPKNIKGVSFVEMTHPAVILKEVVLIDTPGIGSAHRHNTEMTLNFLSECDAALFLISADPPITEVELEFLGEVRRNVRKVFFVLNKTDYLSESEQEIAIQYFRKMLAERIGFLPDGEIFPVSARRALMAKESGDPALLSSSGLTRVTDYLIQFLAREKSRLLEEAIAGKALDLLQDAMLQVNLEKRSLEMPIDDLERRLTLFRKKIEEAKYERQQTQDILNGNRHRVIGRLEEECVKLREKSLRHLEAVANAAFASESEPDAARVRNVIAQEIPVYFEHTLGDVTRHFDAELFSILSGHRERAFRLVESIREAASNIFDIPHHTSAAPRPLALAREPYWVTRRSWSGMLSAVSPDLFERALPRQMREQRVRARIMREIQSLVVQNVENLRWATLQNIDAAFRAFARELDEELAQTVEATHGAIAAAYTRKKERNEEIAGRAALLQKTSAELQSLIGEFTPLPRSHE
ncbi:MAG: dynamin family protein [Methanomicrobiales archaeon]|nr:dynamin family protein [Methanomicrobiales archaeon]